MFPLHVGQKRRSKEVTLSCGPCRRWLPCAFHSSATPRMAPEEVEGNQRGSHQEQQRAHYYGQIRLRPGEACDQWGVQTQRDGCSLAQRPGAPDGDAEENEAYCV